MAKFPKSETKILELAQNVKYGLATYPADFPSIDPADLNMLIDATQAARDDADGKRSLARQATVTKNGTVGELESLLKKIIKQAEVDCADNPSKLTEIGWAPRSEPVPSSVPNAPTDLVSANEVEGTLTLNWKRPVHDANRPVVNFIVQRRQHESGDVFSEWILADSCLKNTTHLIGQPRGVQLEYRVIATNLAGSSLPSNTVPVVL